MNMVAPGFHLVRVIRQASAPFAFAAILAVALAPVTVAAAAGREGSMPQPEAMQGPTSAAVNYALGPTTIRVRQEQRLYRFSGSTATVASQRTVDFGLGALFSSPGEVEKIGDRNYIQITSGTYDGWWVAAPAAWANRVTRYATPLALKLSARDYYGIRFYDAGDVRSRLAVTVEAETTFHADRKGSFAGRTFYRMTDGPLAGRWVNANAVSVDKTGSGDSGSRTEPVATWRGIVLIYDETDVTFEKADGSTYHLRATMSSSMKSLVDDVLSRFRSSVRTWSGGLVAMDMDIVKMDHPITALGELGSSYWVGPAQVRSDLNELAPAGKYDSIFVIWQAKDASGERVPVGGWGLTLPPGSWANGAGYSSVITPTWEWWWTNAVAREEVFIHEWMHQVIYFNEQQGRPAGTGLHDAEAYGYEQVNGSWNRWLKDVMQGKVWNGEEYVGVSPEMWAAGTPTNP